MGAQYLTITRPDLAVAINSLSLFLHCLTNEYFQAVKRILRYFKRTLNCVLRFYHPSDSPLTGYFDVDWARCLETRCSTYGYPVFLCDNLVC